MRIHTNASRPLPLEASIGLPGRFNGVRLCEATRLCVARDAGSALVRNALFKAFYLFSLHQGIDAMVIAGRAPLDRVYERLLFEDVFAPRAFFDMAHMANLPHRVMTLAPRRAEGVWRTRGHALFDFAFRTRHPDIEVHRPPLFGAGFGEQGAMGVAGTP